MSALEVRNLSFHYPDGTVALRDVSLTLEPRSCIGLVGPNGAGKSTLLLHLNGILPGRDAYEHHHAGAGDAHVHDTRAHIRVGELELTARNIHEIRRRVGVLFQDPDDQLFCPTVIEDVMFGPRNLGHSRQEALDIAHRCLADVGLTGFDHRLPHHLSFGERKRVCLAGVLACSPSILALDEPTGNLDPAARRHFITLVRQIALPTIIATHDLELVVDLCDRVLMMDKGQVHANGPMRDILGNAELLAQHQLEMPLSLRYAINRGLASA